MPSALEQELLHWFGHAVLVARGAADAHANAQKALAAGDPLRALQHARELLVRVPTSPIGLLLAVDASEAAWLDEQASMYLEQLSRVVPWRAEVWLRLGLARLRAGLDRNAAREALRRAAAMVEAPAAVVEGAVSALAELDLEAGDPARALVWLALARSATEKMLELRALAFLQAGDLSSAQEAAKHLSPPKPLEGRRALVCGRLAAHGEAQATSHLIRAYILEVPGALRSLALHMACAGESAIRTILPVVQARGEQDHPLFRAAFAQARGDRPEARQALSMAARGGDTDAAQALLALALQDRDLSALHEAHQALAAHQIELSPAETALCKALEHHARGALNAALDALDGAGELPWAIALRQQIMRAWTPPDGFVEVAAVLGQIHQAARFLDDTPALLSIEALVVEAERPLRCALLGEFNTGKSTFLNALLGADVAPTGVLPTTATLHHVVFSPDPFARISIKNRADRTVSHERLRAALAEIQQAGEQVVRVTLGVAQESLRRMEILDTPGFNAPDALHSQVARSAWQDAHVALWLMDASQPLKETERAVLTELRDQGLPVFVVLNKADRMPPEQLLSVIAYAEEGLRRSALTPLAPVMSISARLALRGMLGEPGSLARSGWLSVKAEMEESLVARADSWKDLALRRRARGVLKPLLGRVRSLSAEELEGARQEATKRAMWLEAAALLGRDNIAASTAAEVQRALDGPRHLLAEDLAPLQQGQGDVARVYAAQRVVQRLAMPLTEALFAMLPQIHPYRVEALQVMIPQVAACLQGLVWGLGHPSDLLTMSTVRVMEATLESVVAVLRAGPLPRERSASRTAAAWVLRLEALDAGLGGLRGTGGSLPA